MKTLEEAPDVIDDPSANIRRSADAERRAGPNQGCQKRMANDEDPRTGEEVVPLVKQNLLLNRYI
jgi:hypothetical protein